MDQITRRTQQTKRTRKSPKIVIFVVVFILLAILFFRMATVDTSVKIVKTYELPSLPETSNLISLNYGQQAAAVDGQIIYESNPSGTKTQPIASTAKMILGLAIMQEKPFPLGESGETITITSEFYDLYRWYLENDGSTTAVEIGEEISEYDALASVFLASSNNLADSLAIWAFGSLENYSTYANNMLKSWGLEDTFVGADASGYRENTVSSATDLAKIGHKLLENPVLSKIVGTKYYTVPVAGTLTNSNSLLGVSNISGVKTGYGGDASGYCLILSYQLGDHLITTALLGAPTRSDSFTDSGTLVETLQSILKETTLVEEGASIGYLETWWGGHSDIIAEGSYKTLAWSDSANSAELIADTVSASAAENLSLKLTLNGPAAEIPASAKDYKPKPTLFQRFQKALGLI